MERFTFSRDVRLLLCEEGDDQPVASWDLTIRFGFTPAMPEIGTTGPVENYDPGCGAELWIDEVRFATEAEKMPDARAMAWAETWMALNRDDLIQRGEEVASECHDEF